ncbi:FAD:protein FMN transferase [Olivibacter ginsenosidimutans]|uniref:FAD:protein FMN transferase n=1 Tax=Olivibacter ginsenosidimutans TaxID=1176537 RepID=A0ABP9BIM0_9SPHI
MYPKQNSTGISFIRLKYGILTVLAGLFCSFSLADNKEDEQRFQISGYAQGTTYQINYYSSSEAISKQTIDLILAGIDSSMSIYKSYSQISQFNNSEEGILIDHKFRTVIEKSLQIFHDTKGLFDITVGPLVAAWGFGTKNINSYPDSAKIASIKACVGTNFLELNGNFLRKKKPCVNIDVNGIAQGYSVDVVADYLLKQGIKHFVVEIGGELRIHGKKPDGSLMRIGIEGPANDDDEPIIKHIVGLSSGAITTSGNYRKFRKNGSTKITHLIDPRTGYPLANELISVTLFAQDAITADGYDNAVMAMHLEEALQFVDRHPSLEAYIIYHDKKGNVADTMTNGFRQLLIKEDIGHKI